MTQKSQPRRGAERVELVCHPNRKRGHLVLDDTPRPARRNKEELIQDLFRLRVARKLNNGQAFHLLRLILHSGMQHLTKEQVLGEQPHTARLLDGLRDEHARPGQQSHGHRHVPIDTLGGARVPKHRGHGRDRRAHAPQR